LDSKTTPIKTMMTMVRISRPIHHCRTWCQKSTVDSIFRILGHHPGCVASVCHGEINQRIADEKRDVAAIIKSTLWKAAMGARTDRGPPPRPVA